MSEAHETAPVDRLHAGVTRTAAIDPLVELEFLREQGRRWRRTALGLGAAFIFLFVLSLVQFLGTFTACKLLHEARRESARVNREAAEYLREIRTAQQLQQPGSAAAKLTEANRTAEMKAKPRELEQEIPKQQPEDRGMVREQEIQDLLEQIRKNRQAMKQNILPGHEPDKNCPFPIK